MIFILGGRGFVGSAFVRYCQQNRLEHTVIDRANYAEFIGHSCDVLINANGNSKKFLAHQQPLQDFDASVRSVRASLIDFHAALYIYLSSCDVYPDCSSPILTQETSEPDPARQSPYGFHKYLAEACVRHAAERWLIIRQGGFVGPGMKKNPIFDILRGGPLWLDPASELQYLHTDDNAKIIFELIRQGINNEIINVCGKGLISLQEVINLKGSAIEVKAGSPRVRYDVSIEKLSTLVDVPETRQTVIKFLHAELKA